jgi:hypothetical protein
MDSIMHKHKNRVKDDIFLANARDHLSLLASGTKVCPAGEIP